MVLCSVLYCHDEELAAFRKYQVLLSQSGQQVAFELEHDGREANGVVDRFAAEIRGNETIYYVHIEDVPHLFTGTSETSHKMPLTKPGDKVKIGYIASSEDVIPISKFDNLSLTLTTSVGQQEMTKRVDARKQAVDDHLGAKTAKDELKDMSDTELKRLMELKKEADQKK